MTPVSMLALESVCAVGERHLAPPTAGAYLNAVKAGRPIARQHGRHRSKQERSNHTAAWSV